MTTRTVAPKRKALPPAAEDTPAVSDQGVNPFPDDGGVHGGPGVGDENEATKGLLDDDGPGEKYGAQVLRRVHQDHMILMEEYDEMLEHLEDDTVRKLVESILSGLDKVMTQVEDTFSGHEHYKDYPPIEGAEMGGMGEGKGLGESDAATDQGLDEGEGGDLPTAQNKAEPELDDSETEDVPTGEEALTGMQQGAEEMPAGAPEEEPEETAETKALRIQYIKALRQHVRTKDGATLGIEQGHVPGPDAQLKDIDPLATQDSAINVEDPQSLNLLPHHVGNLAEAHAFLKDLQGMQELDDPNRQKAYHHHRNLSDIAEHAKSQFVGDRNYWAEEAMEGEHKALFDAVISRLHLQKRWKELKDSMAEDDMEEKMFLQKRWKALGTKFPELDRQYEQVNVNDPTSPNSHVKPGEDSAIQRWKPSESLITKFGKSLAKVGPFPALKQQDEQVDISHPSSPIKLGGKDPHQQFGGASLVAGRKDFPLETQDDTANVQHPHLKAIKDAADYLGRVAHEKAYGMMHREEAGKHYKALEPVVSPEPPTATDDTPGGDGGMDMPEGAAPMPEPGEMGEKHILARQIQNNSRAAARLATEFKRFMESLN